MIVWECLISLYSFDRAMENDGNGPDLRESLSRQIASAIPLGKGQGRVLPLSLESGIAGVFTVFDPAKKRLERQIDANRHVLERLGIDRLKRRSDLFQGRKCPDLGIQGKTGTGTSPTHLSDAPENGCRASGTRPSADSEAFPVYWSDTADT